MSAIDEIISDVLTSEGWPRYTDNPLDRGGPTKGGITLPTLSDYLGRPAKVSDLQALDEATARKLYEHLYVVKPGFDLVEDEMLREQLVDTGVLSGVGRAARWLQQAAGVPVDGRLGKLSLAAINNGNPRALAVRLAVFRTRGLADIIHDNPSQVEWINGWIGRATSFLLKEVAG